MVLVDTKGEEKIIINEPKKTKEKIYVIDDTREGWVSSVKILLESYFFEKRESIVFDYSQIREAGLPLKTFGGLSSGPDPLKELHENLRIVLNKNINHPITTTTIVDIMNLIGKCVISGNVRRTAEIAFGEYDSDEFMNLKNYEINPHRMAYGWTSNNSIFAPLGMDYKNVCQRIVKNGEPGICWLENMKKYSRMVEIEDNKDYRVKGGNPCMEQSLESMELCCLVETFPNRHETLDDFLRTLKYAFLYAKTVTLVPTNWPETNRVMMRNRRIGCSISGIAQFLCRHNIHEFKEWLTKGYNTIKKWDHIYSEWFAIPRSIKITSVKPSGTISLLAGATPGIHYPESRYYIRRVRLARNSPLVDALQKANYKIESCFGSEKNTIVVEIPIDIGENIRTQKEVSIWEQLSLSAFIQKYWADNQVSATISFDPKTEGNQIEYALNYFQYQLKSISFLPKIKCGSYPQMPYEEISKDVYNNLIINIKKIQFDKMKEQDHDEEIFCDGFICLENK